MTLRDQITTLLTGEYKGDLDARDLSSMLDVPKAAIQRELHAMSRAGLLMPRAYRLFDLPNAATPGLAETKLEREILSVLSKEGPKTRRALALSVGLDGASGGLKVSLSRLHTYAKVSPPRCPWVKP